MRRQKRRKQGKTDYCKRMKLLKRNSPRIIFRKTNKHIISQYVLSNESKDIVKYGLKSSILEKYGWPKGLKGSFKSLPAAYLTGFIFGKKIQKEENKEDLSNLIVDSGMIIKIHKNRFFSWLKGLKDSGINIKCEEEFFPSEDRIKGKHLKEDFSKTFEKIKSEIENKRKK